ncbi:glycosyltransferase family 2 protein [Parabacteroides sp. APC149_11_2_Y6]
MTSYTVAVIIPSLNEERYISDCLDSLIKQTFPFEEMDVMIIDGGSIDKTKEIVAFYVEKYANVRFINNPGKIQSIAFNIGVKESEAPFIIRLDAHALYDKHYIERCILNMKKIPNLGNVGGRCSICPRHEEIVSEANAILNQSRFGIGGAAFRVSNTPAYVDTVPFGTFSRAVVEKVGGMREDLPRGEDNEYNSRIRKAGYKIYFDPRIIATYYVRDTVKASVKQMYANGLSIGKLFYIDRSSISVRHLVPLLFVLSLFFLALLSFIFPFSLYLLLLDLSLYFVVNITASIIACCKFGFKYLVILPYMFMAVHLSYGWGTIMGLLKR